MDPETTGIIIGLVIGVAVAVFFTLRIIRKKRISEDKRTGKNQ